MKNDPEYENYVLNRVRSAYSVSSLSAGSNNVSYDVIGASPEECYGYAGPVGNSSSNFQSASVSASAVSAYEDTISTFSKNVIESQKL